MNWLAACAAVFAAWNAYVFALYGLDKARARRGARRVSEKALLLAAAFMGAPGALLAMHIFHHKTRHLRFRLGVPLMLIVSAGAVYAAYRAATALGAW